MRSFRGVAYFPIFYCKASYREVSKHVVVGYCGNLWYEQIIKKYTKDKYNALDTMQLFGT